ncbi:MAG: ABC transporter permease subunit, partial [Candidatus Micropelagos thuwalensis]|nr:ABC transporter permease subunit [Candidatus Micropelagos thuwalensis]
MKIISSLWSSQNGRKLTVQILMVAAFLGLVWWLVDNTIANLARQNVATGFGFLDNNTGFDINQKLIAYDETSSYQRLLLVGLLNTAIVSVLGIFFATVIGFMLGLARLSDNWLVSKLAFLYIEIFRNLPLLIQILFWYVLLIDSAQVNLVGRCPVASGEVKAIPPHRSNGWRGLKWHSCPYGNRH